MKSKMLDLFRPTKFSSFFEIEDLHIQHATRCFLHYRFTEEQYVNKRLPNSFRSWRFYIYHIILEMIVFTGLVLSYTKLTDFFILFNHVMTVSFGIKESEKISFLYL